MTTNGQIELFLKRYLRNITATSCCQTLSVCFYQITSRQTPNYFIYIFGLGKKIIDIVTFVAANVYSKVVTDVS